MADDYYSYAPLMRLPRPLTLVGIPGANVGLTARAMNLQSGIPFVWVDRQVEHRRGRSVELLQVEEGDEARLAHERDIVHEALAQDAPPIVACSDVTFADPALARRLEADTDVVLLHVDVDAALDRVLQEAGRDPRRHWALRDGGTLGREAVRGRLARASQRLRHLPRVVLVGDRAPLTVARDLLAELGLPAET